MTTKLETPAKQDFLEEVSEWIEALDDVVATDWEQGAELLGALKQRVKPKRIGFRYVAVNPVAITVLPCVAAEVMVRVIVYRANSPPG